MHRGSDLCVLIILIGRRQTEENSRNNFFLCLLDLEYRCMKPNSLFCVLSLRAVFFLCYLQNWTSHGLSVYVWRMWNSENTLFFFYFAKRPKQRTFCICWFYTERIILMKLVVAFVLQKEAPQAVWNCTASIPRIPVYLFRCFWPADFQYALLGFGFLLKGNRGIRFSSV